MMAGAMPGLVIGRVVDVLDPEKQGRIRVDFPWLDQGLQTDWIPVVGPLAGPDRGLYFMPEVGDEVVVGFIQGDFNHPVVLGSMWNGQSPAPSPDPRQRMIRSKNGHTIRFVDSTPNGGDMGALIVEDPHGNVIVMTNTHMTVKAKVVLQLDAPVIVLKGPGWARTVTPSTNPI
jgi:phage baseplate assembly protein V